MFGAFRYPRSRREAVAGLIAVSNATRWERDYLKSLSFRREMWEEVGRVLRAIPITAKF